MQEIIECIIKNLVEDKASVSVKEVTENSELKYEIKVNEKDMDILLLALVCIACYVKALASLKL